MFHHALTPSYSMEMTSPCVSTTPPEPSTFPSGLAGWRMPSPHTSVVSAASLQHLHPPFQEQQPNSRPSQVWGQHRAGNGAIPWLLGLCFHTCATLVLFVRWVTQGPALPTRLPGVSDSTLGSVCPVLWGNCCEAATRAWSELWRSRG